MAAGREGRREGRTEGEVGKGGKDGQIMWLKEAGARYLSKAYPGDLYLQSQRI